MQAHIVPQLSKLLSCDTQPYSDYHVDRYLFDDGKVRYIKFNTNAYEPDDHPEPLSPLSVGDWNTVVVTNDSDTGQAYFCDPSRIPLKGVRSTWHDTSFDHLDLGLYDQDHEPTSRVYTLPTLGIPPRPTIAKIARNDGEIFWIENECAVYQQLQGKEIAPEFLGYVTEEGRTIGFLLEKIDNFRYPQLHDREICEAVLMSFHDAGYFHGDCHKGNFLIKDGRAHLIDFETATRIITQKQADEDLDRLQSSLSSESSTPGDLK